MPSGLITLITDFGTTDPYVGAMKGAILSAWNGARILDITHEIPPQDVQAGALAMLQYVPYYPPGTVHVAVVDPGVGTERSPIVIETERSLLVGPDNGVLSLIARKEGIRRTVRIANPNLIRREVSTTFHGRDVFGPAAAHLARGVPAARFGDRVESPIQLAVPEPAVTSETITGRILHVDRFGNAVSNIARETVMEREWTGPIAVECGSVRVVGINGTYADTGPGDALALFGSAGLLEIAVNAGSAAEAFGIARGDVIRLSARTDDELA